MIDETLLPRQGLFDRTFSVLAEIRLYCKLYLRYKREAENDLVVRHSEYSESSLDCMGMDEFLVSTC